MIETPPARGEIIFEPGSYHLMFMCIAGDFKEDDETWRQFPEPFAQ